MPRKEEGKRQPEAIEEDTKKGGRKTENLNGKRRRANRKRRC